MWEREEVWGIAGLESKFMAGVGQGSQGTVLRICGDQVPGVGGSGGLGNGKDGVCRVWYGWVKGLKEQGRV